MYIKLRKILILLLTNLGLSGILSRFFFRNLDFIGIYDDNLPTLLALNANRFRGELQIIRKQNKFNIATIKYENQTKFYTVFRGENFRLEKENLSEIQIKNGKKYQALIANGLNRQKKKINLLGVLSNNMMYLVDYDWGMAAKRAELAYFVLYRGGLLASKGLKNEISDRFSYLTPFQGDKILVQNDITKNMLLDSGFLKPHQVETVGNCRMDRLALYSPAPPANEEKRQQVALFSFSHATGFSGVGQYKDEYQALFDSVWSKTDFGFVQLFEKVHQAFGQFALENPDIDVVIKPKWDGTWTDKILATFEKANIPAKMSNLTISSELDPHEVILNSDVICCFGSTTLLEAAIVGKPVIMPVFAEAIEEKYQDYVLFNEYKSLFDIASSEQHMKSLLLKRLKDPAISEECMVQREAAFRHFVSSIFGGSAERIATIIAKKVSNI